MRYAYLVIAAAMLVVVGLIWFAFDPAGLGLPIAFGALVI